MMNNVFLPNLENEQANVRCYLAETGIILFVSVLTIADAQAGRFSPGEVVVYNGVAPDYSNRSDVIFIDDREDNFQLAQKAGMNGIVFVSPEQLQQDLNTLIEL